MLTSGGSRAFLSPSRAQWQHLGAFSTSDVVGPTLKCPAARIDVLSQIVDATDAGNDVTQDGFDYVGADTLLIQGRGDGAPEVMRRPGRELMAGSGELGVERILARRPIAVTAVM